jgi:hypothetical protein
MKIREPGFHEEILVAGSHRSIGGANVRGRQGYVVAHLVLKDGGVEMGPGNALFPINVGKAYFLGLFHSTFLLATGKDAVYGYESKEKD